MQTALTMAEDFGQAHADFTRNSEDALSPRQLWHVLCLTWKPGEYAKVYRDGELLLQLPRAPVDLPVGTVEVALKGQALHLANEDGSTPGSFDTQFDAALVFRRALHVDEIDIVGTYLADRVGIDWGRVVT